MILSKETYLEIEKELAKFPKTKRRSAAIAAMTIAQEQCGWLSPEVMEELAAYLGCLPVQLAEVASFYSMFNTKPVGRFKIAVCCNLPCEMNGSLETAEYLKAKLGIDFGETTADGEFTLVKSECMGSCGDGPVILVNNKRMFFKMTKNKIDDFLEELRR